MSFKYKFKQFQYHFKKHLFANASDFVGLHYKFFWNPKPGTHHSIIDWFSKRNPNLNFIQIGGNDGFRHDPICRFIKRDNWNGVILEPQKSVFPILSYVYKQDGLTLLNKAIDKEVKQMTLYKIAFSDARWATGLASFNKEAVEQTIDSGYAINKAIEEGITPPKEKVDQIAEEKVDTTTFEEIISNFTNKIDLIQIDTEGFDFEVIKMIPFDTIQPGIITYELEKLSEEDKIKCNQYLSDKGYSIVSNKRDGIAIETSIFDPKIHYFK